MSLESILVITKGGVPIASYPEDVSPDRTVFSGILAALVESGKRVGMGEIDKVTIGDKIFLVKGFKEIFIVITLNSDIEGGALILESLYSAMRKVIDFLSFDEGYVNDEISVALRNIIKTHYDAFNYLVEKYKELLDIYITARKMIGTKASEMLKNFLSPLIEVELEDWNIKIKKVNADSPDVLLDAIDSAIKNMKKYLTTML